MPSHLEGSWLLPGRVSCGASSVRLARQQLGAVGGHEALTECRCDVDPFHLAIDAGDGCWVGVVAFA